MEMHFALIRTKRCLFCKGDSTASRSVEHIIPESLGNSTALLPPGVVCDVCNNYFARKVEAPFLHSPALLNLRFRQRLPNKRGRVPSLEGVIRPDIPAELCFYPKYDLTSIGVPLKALPDVLQRSSLEAVFPLDVSVPPDAITSRFLAKIALEAMAARLVPWPDGIAYLVDEPQLDEIRMHARYGKPGVWPFHVRTIYDADGATVRDGKLEQVIHESDILVTPWGEWLHVLAIFGVEFAINLGGPEIEGYLKWLSLNGNASPLYRGQSASIYEVPR